MSERLTLNDIGAGLKVLAVVVPIFMGAIGAAGSWAFSAGTFTNRIESVERELSSSIAKRKEIEVILQQEKERRIRQDEILINMAINVCELRALAAGEPITPCQQIRNR